MNFEESLKIAVVAALSGGLAVFVSERLSSLLKRILERKIRHYNSLVFYEGQLNKNLSRLHDILFTIPNIEQALKNGKISWNNLKKIDFDDTRLTDIYSVSLRNCLGLYEVDLYKINDDIESLMSGYKEIKQAFISRNISFDEYRINCNNIIKNLELIYQFTELSIENLLDALAEVRLRIKSDKPKSSIFIAKTITMGLKENSESEFDNERKKLDEEINEVSQKRKKEIDKILNFKRIEGKSK